MALPADPYLQHHQPQQTFVPAQPRPLTLALFSYLEELTDTERVAQDCARADLVVSLGAVNLEQLVRAMPQGKPALCVLGPRDRPEVPPPFRVLHGNGFTFRGWRIAGLSGALLRGRGAAGNYVSELDASTLLEALPPCDILLTHAPPSGIDAFERSGIHHTLGLVSIVEYLEIKRPLYHFFAHPYAEDVEEYSDDTLSVGVHGQLLTPPLELT